MGNRVLPAYRTRLPPALFWHTKLRRFTYLVSVAALSIATPMLLASDALAFCSPVHPVAGATVTCAGAVNPLAPSNAASADNLTVSVNPGSTAGVLLGLGGAAFTLLGNNLTVNNFGAVDPPLLGSLNLLSSGLVVGRSAAGTVSVNNNGILAGTRGMLCINLPILTGMALSLQNGEGGTTKVVNTGTIILSPLLGASVEPGYMSAVAIHGGSQVSPTVGSSMAGSLSRPWPRAIASATGARSGAVCHLGLAAAIASRRSPARWSPPAQGRPAVRSASSGTACPIPLLDSSMAGLVGLHEPA